MLENTRQVNRLTNTCKLKPPKSHVNCYPPAFSEPSIITLAHFVRLQWKLYTVPTSSEARTADINILLSFVLHKFAWRKEKKKPGFHSQHQEHAFPSPEGNIMPVTHGGNWHNEKATRSSPSLHLRILKVHIRDRSMNKSHNWHCCTVVSMLASYSGDHRLNLGCTFHNPAKLQNDTVTVLWAFSIILLILKLHFGDWTLLPSSGKYYLAGRNW